MGTSTFFVFSWKPGIRPGLHAIVHGDHLLQRSNLQFRSQLPVLHASVSTGVSQNLPPWFGFTSTERVFCRAPPPHSFVHFDQPDHFDMTQSTEHLYWPHLVCFRSAGHTMPNWLAFTMMPRLNVFVPPQEKGSILPPTLLGHELSHRTEHSSALQSETSQSEIFDGGETVLDLSTSFLTLRTAQTSVKSSSSTLALHTAVCFS
mmetsp:Transcript_123741/g.346551  ORF Transcript_123741/g.346551 Transcript_123741/m.346551 type:complete len:204 (-) Transcript_123741:1356-1967(-)